MDDSSRNPPLSERKIWVHGNLNSKLRVCRFGAEGVEMKQQSRLLVSTHSSSINNYVVREMAKTLNGSVSKVVKEARQEEFHK